MAHGGEMVTAPFTPVESVATNGVKMSVACWSRSLT